jgi:hypothetical protein
MFKPQRSCLAVPSLPSRSEKSWECDTGTITVVFAEPDKVHSAFFIRNMRSDYGPFELLKWRGERLWRRWFPEK